MRTLLVSDNVVDPVTSRLRTILRAKVDDQGPATTDFAEVTKRLPQVEAELLVVVLSPDPEGGLQTLRKVRELIPDESPE